MNACPLCDVYFCRNTKRLSYEVVNASTAEEKIREEVVVEIADVLESIGIPNITAALATPLADLLGNGTTTGNETTAELPLRIVYEAVSKEL